jgi:hypothetical protein
MATRVLLSALFHETPATRKIALDALKPDDTTCSLVRTLLAPLSTEEF